MNFVCVSNVRADGRSSGFLSKHCAMNSFSSIERDDGSSSVGDGDVGILNNLKKRVINEFCKTHGVRRTREKGFDQRTARRDRRIESL